MSALICGVMLACNALSGVGDLSIGDEADAALPGREGDALQGAVDDDASVPAPPPTCACVAAPAAGWTGPVALLEAAGDAGRPCPTGLVSVASGGEDADVPAQGCAPCTCDPPTGACASASLDLSSSSSCSASCATKTIGSGCSTLAYCAPSSSFQAAMLTDGGSCAPKGGGLAPAGWKASATACSFESPMDGGCSAAQVCAPKSLGAPDAKTCILKESDEPCPPGPYTQRVVYFGQLGDGRSCSACGCGAPNVTCSTPTITLYADTSCMSVMTTMNLACKAFGSVPGPQGSAKITTASTVTSGGCSPTGGALSGGVTPSAPRTLCCLP